MNTKFLICTFLPTLTAAIAAEPRSCCSKELRADAPLTDKSLYQVTSTWTNDARASVQLASFRGRPTITTMFFANCEFACPILVNDMKRIDAALPDKIKTNI